MAKKPRPTDPKALALRRQGCLHPHPEQVTDPLFGGSDFFDARDLVQRGRDRWQAGGVAGAQWNTAIEEATGSA